MLFAKTFTKLKASQFVCLILLSFLISCVGTVEQADPNKTAYFEPSANTFEYQGLYAVTPIAHDKLEIEFYATQGFADGIFYYLYVNDGAPILLEKTTVDESMGGRYRYLLKGLNINSQYKIRIAIINNLAETRSVNEKIITAQTFDNRVGDFLGINRVTKVVGQGDKSIKVEWIPAKFTGTFAPTDYDPSYYQIYVTESAPALNHFLGDQPITPEKFPGSGSISTSTDVGYTTITNLRPSTTYYVQMRTVHTLWNRLITDGTYTETTIPFRRELNTKFLKVKTDSSTSLIDLDKESLELSNAAGSEGLTKVIATWKQGEGAFAGYKMFWREYTGSGDASTDPWDVSTLQTYIGNSQFIQPDQTSFKIPGTGGLTSYKWYQFRLVLCKTSACPVNDPLSPDYGIVSDMKAIKVQPRLAPFSGITFLRDPQDVNVQDKMRVEFDAPVTSIGYADELEIYCVNPTNHSIQYKMSAGAPLTGITDATNCNGLYLENGLSLTDNHTLVRGVKNINTSPAAQANYCFAMTPAIRAPGFEAAEIPPLQRIVRCIQPEIKVPTITQYPGIKGLCRVDENKISIDWEKPTGGVYNKFQVFHRTINGGDSFRFSDAVSGDSDYTSSALLDANTTTYTITGLEPGQNYKVGVLSVAYDSSANTKIYSEYNIKIQGCYVPLPTAEFKEWTRIFAIGPKINGLVSPTALNRIPTAAFIPEAVEYNGIPYEVDMSTGTPAGYKVVTGAPMFGATYPSNYTEQFDGKPNDTNQSFSKSGIVSIAWKDVSLQFMKEEFKTRQDHGNRGTRKFGYRVYRSDNNRLTWKEVTDASKLLHSIEYRYYKRPGALALDADGNPERIAFFTDYSVKNVDVTSLDTQARIFWYKIVPVYNNHELVYSNAKPANIIKVTLPPPNMALVHRMMANRSACLEIDKEIDHNNHYRCNYNGVGNRPKGFPWVMAETVIDQGGDLLIDRFELGCNITRGDNIADPSDPEVYKRGASYFKIDPDGFDATTSDDFLGYASDADGNATLTPFRGCIQIQGKHGPSRPIATYDGGNYKKILFGDCFDTNSTTLPLNECASLINGSQTVVAVYPGFKEKPAGTERTCLASDNNNFDDPKVAYAPTGKPSYFDRSYLRRVVTQGEFAAVHFNKVNSRHSAYQTPVYGPTTDGTSFQSINGMYGSYSLNASCRLNLAAMGSDGWESRWLSTAEMTSTLAHNGGRQNLTTKTVGEVLAMNNIYNQSPTGTLYKNPEASDSNFLNSARYNKDTPLSRIFSSNNAKLPPLTGLSLPQMQAVCGSYKVAVGYKPDDSGFVTVAPAKSKRLMRRQEYVAAAAWPTNASATVNPQSVDYNNTTIANIEIGIGNAGCVGPTKVGADNDQKAGLDISPQKFGLSTGASTYVMTGSSKRDNSVNSNSELCISRYGIQDVVGNLWESVSNKLFCDYSKDSLYYGDKIAGIGDKGKSAQLKRIYGADDYMSDYHYFITRYDAVPPLNDGARIKLPDGSFTTAPMPWADVNPDSGYCSIVDDDSLRAYSTLSVSDPTPTSVYFRDSDAFRNILRPNGTVDSYVVTRENDVDKMSPDYLRNGDGYFLNFGKANLAPQLSQSHTVALDASRGIPATEYTAKGPYFNPYIGMPLSCNGESICDSNSSDNKEVTTSYFNSNYFSGLIPPTIANFPTGNSQIYFTGISAFSINTSTLTLDPTAPSYWPQQLIYQVNTGASMNDFSFEIISPYTIMNTGITVNNVIDSDGDGILDAPQTYTGLQDTTLYMTRIGWNIPRFSQLGLTSGGSYQMSGNGRYTMTNNVVGPQERYMMSDIDYGVRCSILINEND